MKKGMAMRGNESMPANMRVGMIIKEDF